MNEIFKEEGAQPKILPLCYKVAEHENVIWVCDGAANIGQIGHAIGVLLTNLDKARLCCTTAIAADSKPHIEIAKKVKKNIIINGCGNRCASKVMERAGEKADYEFDISKHLQKIPTLDIYEADVKKISKIIIEKAEL
ncbi:MAG: putative zinc-binding protein [Candidatus Bathyarchaeia archaeon]